VVISLTDELYQLLKRMNLVFFMNTSNEAKTLTTLILIDFKNIRYPPYEIIQTRFFFFLFFLFYFFAIK